MLTRLRVVGDGDVLEPAAWAAATISLERRLAVAGGRVHVQVAREIGEFDQLRQLAGRGPVELLAGLADLRRETGQIHRCVDVASCCRRCTRRSSSVVASSFLRRRERRRTR